MKPGFEALGGEYDGREGGGGDGSARTGSGDMNTGSCAGAYIGVGADTYTGGDGADGPKGI